MACDRVEKNITAVQGHILRHENLTKTVPGGNNWGRDAEENNACNTYSRSCWMLIGRATSTWWGSQRTESAFGLLQLATHRGGRCSSICRFHAILRIIS